MRIKTGIVLGSKMAKTIVVQVENLRTHPKYKKLMRTSKKFYAHDPESKYHEGDKVTIYETKPLSRLKRWTVVKPVNNQ